MAGTMGAPFLAPRDHEQELLRLGIDAVWPADARLNPQVTLLAAAAEYLLTAPAWRISNGIIQLQPYTATLTSVREALSARFGMSVLPGELMALCTSCPCFILEDSGTMAVLRLNVPLLLNAAGWLPQWQHELYNPAAAVTFAGSQPLPPPLYFPPPPQLLQVQAPPPPPPWAPPPAAQQLQHVMLSQALPPPPTVQQLQPAPSQPSLPALTLQQLPHATLPQPSSPVQQLQPEPAPAVQQLQPAPPSQAPPPAPAVQQLQQATLPQPSPPALTMQQLQQVTLPQPPAPAVQQLQHETLSQRSPPSPAVQQLQATLSQPSPPALAVQQTQHEMPSQPSPPAATAQHAAPASHTLAGADNITTQERVKAGIDAVWPPGTSLSAADQLLRSTAEYLLTCPSWMAGDGMPLPYTTQLPNVGHHLRQHPAKAAVTAKLSSLFERSPYFKQSTQGPRDLLSLNAGPLLAAADSQVASASTAAPATNSWSGVTAAAAKAAQAAPATALPPVAATAQLPSSSSSSGAAGPTAPLQTLAPASAWSGGAGSTVQMLMQGSVPQKDLLQAGIDATWPPGVMLSTREQLQRCAAEYLLTAGAWIGNGRPQPYTDELTCVEDVLSTHPSWSAAAGALPALFDRCTCFELARHDTTTVLSLNVAALTKTAQQRSTPSARGLSTSASQPGAGSAAAVQHSLLVTQQPTVSAHVGEASVDMMRRGVDAIWPPGATLTAEQQLLRRAAEHLLTVRTWNGDDRVQRPFTTHMPAVGLVLAKHPSRSAVSVKLLDLIGGSPYFQHSRQGVHELLGLNVQAVLAASSSLPAASSNAQPPKPATATTSATISLPVVVAAAAAATSLLAPPPAPTSASGLAGVYDSEQKLLQAGIDATWPPGTTLGAMDQLYRCTAVHLLTVRPWCSNGQPQPYTDMLAPVGGMLGKHPSRSAVTESLSSLFQRCPCFVLAAYGTTQVISLNVAVLTNAAQQQSRPAAGGAPALVGAVSSNTDMVRTCIDTIWPPGPALSAEEQLLRAAAQHLLTAPVWTGEDGVPRQFTAQMPQVGDVLSSHPSRSAVVGKLAALFDGSPCFRRLTVGKQVLLSLQAEAMEHAVVALAGQRPSPKAATTPASSRASWSQPADYGQQQQQQQQQRRSGPGMASTASPSFTQDALMRCLDVVWQHADPPNPSDELRRSAAEYLLAASPWKGEDGSLQPNTAPLSAVAGALWTHPHRAGVSDKLDTLFERSPFFQRHIVGRDDLLSLNTSALWAEAHPDSTAAAQGGAGRAAGDANVQAAAATAMHSRQGVHPSSSASSLVAPASGQQGQPFDSRITLGSNQRLVQQALDALWPEAETTSQTRLLRFAVDRMLRSALGRMFLLPDSTLHELCAGWPFFKLSAAPDGMRVIVSLDVPALVKAADDRRAAMAQGSAASASQEPPAASVDQVQGAAVVLKESDGMAGVPTSPPAGSSQQHGEAEASAAGAAAGGEAAEGLNAGLGQEGDSSRDAAQPGTVAPPSTESSSSVAVLGDERPRLAKAIDLIWPPDEILSPEDQLRRCAALHLAAAPLWRYGCEPHAPLPYTDNLPNIGQVLSKHPCRSQVGSVLTQLFVATPFFRKRRCSVQDVVSLQATELLQAASQLPAPDTTPASQLAAPGTAVASDTGHAVLSPDSSLPRSPVQALAPAMSATAAEAVLLQRDPPPPPPPRLRCITAEPAALNASEQSFTAPCTGLLEGAEFTVALSPASEGLDIALPSPVLNVSELSVRFKQLPEVSGGDLAWLLGALQPDSSCSSDLCLGFDIEFKVDRLASIQLGNADRVLLIQVPPGATKESAPSCLVGALTDPQLLKAAAEAWQDVLIVYHSLGIAMAGVVCLTRSLGSLSPESKPGLFTMMNKLFPDCGLEEDQSTCTSDWYTDIVSPEQLRVRSLDAFASWVVAAGRRDLVDQAVHMDLAKVSDMELQLLCNILQVSSFQRLQGQELGKQNPSVAADSSNMLHEQSNGNGAIHPKDTTKACADKALETTINQILHGKASLAGCPALQMLSRTAVHPAAGLQGAERTQAEALVRQLCAVEGLDASQEEAVVDTLLPKSYLQIVQGPPGTGKTHVLCLAAAIWCNNPSLEPPVQQGQGVPLMLCCTHSDAAAINIARFFVQNPELQGAFRLVVSEEHEHMCTDLADHLIAPNQLSGGIQQSLQGQMKVLVCTLAMLCSQKLQERLLHNRCVVRLLVDEASQVYVGDYLVHLRRHNRTLRSITFMGDDKQLPPPGAELTHVHTVFDSHLLWHNNGRAAGVIPSITLDTTYRLPTQLCAFMSQHVYAAALTPADSSTDCNTGQDLVWHHLQGSERVKDEGVVNSSEAEAVRQWAQLLQSRGQDNWKVLSMYDTQRQEIESQLRSQPGLPWEDRVYNVDSFQGREEDVVIVSLARTSSLGFLEDDRRVNVMLTRCKQRLIVVGSFALAWQHPETLIGKLARMCQQQKIMVTQPQ